MKKRRVASAAIILAFAHGGAYAQDADKVSPCFLPESALLSEAFVARKRDPATPVDLSETAPSVLGDSVSFAFAPDLTERGFGKRLVGNAREDDPAGKQESARGGFDLHVETTSSDSRAGLAFTDTRSRGGDLRVFSAELSAPASENGDTEVTRIGDINTDLKLKLSYTWFASETKPTLNVEALQKLQELLLAGCLKKAADGDKTAAGECPRTVSQDRALPASYCVQRYLGEDGLKDFYPLLTKSQFAPFFGVSGQTGRKSFKFLDTTTGLDAKDRQSMWAIEVFGGVVSPDRHHIWRAGYQHAEDYEDQDKRTICQPPGTGGFQDCRTAPFGAPQKKTKELGVLEYRWFPSEESRLVKGVQARLTFDFENDQYELDVPVYLFKSEDGELNGGIRAGVSSETDGYLAVFVGKKFGLY